MFSSCLKPNAAASELFLTPCAEKHSKLYFSSIAIIVHDKSSSPEHRNSKVADHLDSDERYLMFMRNVDRSKFDLEELFLCTIKALPRQVKEKLRVTGKTTDFVDRSKVDWTWRQESNPQIAKPVLCDKVEKLCFVNPANRSKVDWSLKQTTHQTQRQLVTCARTEGKSSLEEAYNKFTQRKRGTCWESRTDFVDRSKVDWTWRQESNPQIAKPVLCDKVEKLCFVNPANRSKVDWSLKQTTNQTQRQLVTCARTEGKSSLEEAYNKFTQRKRGTCWESRRVEVKSSRWCVYHLIEIYFLLSKLEDGKEGVHAGLVCTLEARCKFRHLTTEEIGKTNRQGLKILIMETVDKLNNSIRGRIEKFPAFKYISRS